MDFSTHKKSTSDPCAFAVVALVMLSTAVFSSEPASKPTPRPGTLGAYATTITLDRSTLGDGDGRVVLTNDSVTALAADGKIILGTVSTDRHRQAKSSSVADNAERARWQAAHHKQRRVIAALERRRSSLALQRDQIENLGLTAKTMARLQQLEAKMLQLDHDIAGERARLARIVRDARRRGAEPGWFR